MSETTKPFNRLLAALPAEEYKLLLPKMEKISLTFSETVYEPGETIRHVYFLTGGIVSLISAAGERSLLEVGIVGYEGFAGLPVFLGVETSNNLAVVQGAGDALRMKTADFQAHCERGGALDTVLKRYTHSHITQISQSAVCNSFHPAEARLARWLLMTGDRMRTDEFQITQEFLSNLLGVRREAVSISATNLQRRDLISYRRRNISIINRAGLEAAACCCYSIIKDEYESVAAGFKTMHKVCG